jgi:hypothetical protein
MINVFSDFNHLEICIVNFLEIYSDDIFCEKVALSWVHFDLFLNHNVAPDRFERKAAAEGRGFYGGHEVIEAEDLPNGFTKIRSKNLDVLFRKDYYTQR